MLRLACTTLSAQVVWFDEEEGSWMLRGHALTPGYAADTSRAGITAAQDSPTHLPPLAQRTEVVGLGCLASALRVLLPLCPSGSGHMGRRK